MTDDTLLTLPDAAEIFLGDRRKVATLRAEAARGNLVISKIGRAYWTTLARLKEMDAKCLVEAPARASGSIRKEAHGLSLTVEADAARDSLLMNLDKLKKPSGNTSPAITKSGIRQHRSLPTFYQPIQRNTSRTK